MATVVLAVFGVVAGTKILWNFYSRMTTSPHRPTLTCFLDSVLDIFMFLKIGLWSKLPDIHRALKEAEQQTKLTDWGSSDFVFVKNYDIARKVGLERSKAKYSPVGHFYANFSLVRAMISRLKLIDYLKKHPAVEKVPLKAPIIITGFTRTGTTFLFEMLGQHKDIQMPYAWEQLNSVPDTDDEAIPAQIADRKKRYDDNKGPADFTAAHMIGKQLQDIHRVSYDVPEECTISCSLGLPLNLFDIPFNPYAIDELAALGAGDTYYQYYRILQLLTWQSPDRRGRDFHWLLKCPFHLPYLNELHAQFPEVTLVWTHRNPVECIASACSLFETLLCMSMEESSVDKKILGKVVMHYTRRCLELAERSVAEMGSKLKILHVCYKDTVSAPLETCRKVLEKAGLKSTPEFESELAAYIKDSENKRSTVAASKKSNQVHSYCPEDYGLTAALIQEEFSDYIKKYNL